LYFSGNNEADTTLTGGSCIVGSLTILSAYVFYDTNVRVLRTTYAVSVGDGYM